MSEPEQSPESFQ